MDEEIEIAKELMTGLLGRMGVEKQVEGSSREGDILLEIKGDEEGILIGKHGRTLDSLQVLISRMVNKRLKRPVRVVLDIDDYRKRRADTLTRMAIRLGEKAKRMGQSVTLGPFSAHDRRTIHIALKEDPSVRTESFGEGEARQIRIIPRRSEEKRSEPLG